MSEELRLYSFCNMYISHIQAGIQTGHMSDNMSVKYLATPGIANTTFQEKKRQYTEWIKDHKTYIILSGGDDEEINRINSLIEEICNKDSVALPIGYFKEPGLGGIRTCCGLVVPERYFAAKKESHDDGGYTMYHTEIVTGDRYNYYHYMEGTLEYQLIELLKSKPLFK